MSNQGFTSTQLKQLSDMFHQVVESLSELINQKPSRDELNAVKNELKGEMSTIKQELKADIKNLSLTMATKYQVTDHEKRLKKLETKTFAAT